MTEAQALAEAQAMYGADAMVWVMTHSLTGQPYKTLRYRVGYKARTQTGRFIEKGRRMKGVGGSWADAVYSAKNFATPRPLSEFPEPESAHQEEVKQVGLVMPEEADEAAQAKRQKLVFEGKESHQPRTNEEEPIGCIASSPAPILGLPERFLARALDIWKKVASRV
jgi:hypothetical protein